MRLGGLCFYTSKPSEKHERCYESHLMSCIRIIWFHFFTLSRDMAVALHQGKSMTDDKSLRVKDSSLLKVVCRVWAYYYVIQAFFFFGLYRELRLRISDSESTLVVALLYTQE